MSQRGSGVLLHVSSLPSPFGIGDLGPEAQRFAEFLAAAGQSSWQILPLGPTNPVHNSSPYHAVSASAGNPLFISPELLVEEGLLRPADLQPLPAFPGGRVDYRGAAEYKERLLRVAEERFRGGARGRPADLRHRFAAFCAESADWLDDYALFAALKSSFRGQSWAQWPVELRDRHPEELAAAGQAFASGVAREKFWQFLFQRQWSALRRRANRLGIQVIGDLPLYLDHDSADLWAHPELFQLDEVKRPLAVSGVPPDYFSRTGQLWGHPLYRWERLQATGFDWWVRRIARSLELYDFVRIDHFRGLVGYWEVPAGEQTAEKGHWVEAPARDFLHALGRRFPSLPFIAEDLGTITPDVREILRQFDLPGMKVLLFAFGGGMPRGPYIPHNYERNCVAYTGTHDSNTARGWFENEASLEEKGRLFAYLGREVPAGDLPWEMVRLLMASVAERVIFPLQDLLGLGQEARMNTPFTREGNWLWRIAPAQPLWELPARLRGLTELTGRI